MKRLIGMTLVFVGLAWGFTTVWVSGYSAGYEQGSETAWDSANRTLGRAANTVQLYDSTDGRVRTVSNAAIVEI